MVCKCAISDTHSTFMQASAGDTGHRFMLPLRFCTSLMRRQVLKRNPLSPGGMLRAYGAQGVIQSNPLLKFGEVPNYIQVRTDRDQLGLYIRLQDLLVKIMRLSVGHEVSRMAKGD